MRDERSKRWRSALAILAVALAAGLAACGDDDDEGQAATGTEPAEVRTATVRVTNYPVVDLTPVHIAISKGYFRQERINVKLVQAPFGPEGVAGMVGGSYEVGLASTMDALAAAGKGLPVKAIAAGRAQNREHDASAIVVSPDSGIRTVADLEGKTIGRDAANSLPDMGLRALLDSEGLDPEGFKGVDVDFPDQIPALGAGRIAAGVTVEPFAAAAEGAGNKSISGVFGIVLPDVPTTTWNVTEKYLSENEDVVERFVRALNRGAADAQANPQLVREALTEFTPTPPPVAKAMELPLLQVALTTEGVQKAVDFALKWGGLKEPVDVESYVAEIDQ